MDCDLGGVPSVISKSTENSNSAFRELSVALMKECMESRRDILTLHIFKQKGRTNSRLCLSREKLWDKLCEGDWGWKVGTLVSLMFAIVRFTFIRTMTMHFWVAFFLLQSLFFCVDLFQLH